MQDTARVVVIGPGEWADGNVRIKDLASGQQADVAVDSL